MSNLRAFPLWFLMLFAIVLLISGVASAEDSTPEQPADPAVLPLGSDIDYSSPATDRVTAIGDWSMLTYQKLQPQTETEPQNWEIYVNDISGPRRLTFVKGIDRHPDLDRGAKRIAFISDRFGDFDLFTMNVNGKATRRIFDNADSTAFPAWSPDGQHIAFQVIIDGQNELYLVDADGSSPQRLTNHPGYDGMPGWSPDGTKLSFVSKRSGDFAIYVMNVDGSDIRKLSTLPFSLHPTWSPDGQTIAFDADIDGDGWQELALIDAGGGNERMIYDPGSNKTAWANRWAPDNSSLAFTEVTAQLEGLEWIWIKGAIRKWESGSGIVDLIPDGREWYADWESKDTIPPTTTIEPLAPYTRAENFVLKWAGVDKGGSGIQSYAVYYNDSSGWKTYWGHTSATQAPFSAQPGSTVEFLVRAIDNAFNQGSWQQQSIAQTTFFNTEISGTVTDNRGNPLSDVPVKSSPPFLFFPVVSDKQGQFTGYTVENVNHSISSQEPNFKAMPNTIVQAGESFFRNFYLLPNDSIILNGTFENNAATPTNWTIGGTLPVAINSQEFATGKYAVQFGHSAAAGARNGVEAAGTASISQKVTIPATMNGPTLSYMARAAAGQPSASSSLRVLVLPDSTTIPTIFEKPISGQWTLYWIDMTPWAGLKVTVTFEMIQGASDPAQTYNLDDVSLGGINPDLWLDLAHNPAMAVPGEYVDMSLQFGNMGPVMAQNASVELVLPPELTLVSATAPYTFTNNVVRWEVGDLAPHSSQEQLSAVITPVTKVKSQVLVDATIDSGTAEMHLRNNSDETGILISKLLYLPIVRAP